MNTLEFLEIAARLSRRLGLLWLNRIGHAILRCVYRNQLTIMWDDFLITGGIEHRHYLAALVRGQMEPGTLRVFRRLVPRGGVVVDVGAYLGVFTLVAARLVGDNGKVLALEVDPRSLPFLKQNIDQNGFVGRTQIIEVAASDTCGTAVFFLNEGGGSASSLVRPRSGYQKIQVPTARLDDLTANLPRVDVMKIDVEGAEVRVLRGAKRLLSRNSDISIICEVNPSALEAGGSSPQELIGVLKEFGFEVFQIDEATGTLIDLPDNWQGVKYVNVLAQRSGEAPKAD